jgi:uncharacterized protein (DUF1810 family)
MTPSEERVVAELHKYKGDVNKVAGELGSSVSFIHRIKKALWQPQDPDLALATQANAQADLLHAIIPPNIKEVRQLRDDTLALLQTRVEDELLTNDDAVKLFKALTQYEKVLRHSLNPAINVFNDNRQQSVTVNALVDELQKLSPQALRLLAEVPDPVIIEVQHNGK